MRNSTVRVRKGPKGPTATEAPATEAPATVEATVEAPATVEATVEAPATVEASIGGLATLAALAPTLAAVAMATAAVAAKAPAPAPAPAPARTRRAAGTTGALYAPFFASGAPLIALAPNTVVGQRPRPAGITNCTVPAPGPVVGRVLRLMAQPGGSAPAPLLALQAHNPQSSPARQLEGTLRWLAQGFGWGVGRLANGNLYVWSQATGPEIPVGLDGRPFATEGGAE